MAIVSCPACRSAVKIADEMLDRQVRCPKCKIVFRGRDGVGEATAPPVTSVSATPPPPIVSTPAEPADTSEEPAASPGLPPRRRRREALDDIYVEPARLEGIGLAIAVRILLTICICVDLLLLAVLLVGLYRDSHMPWDMDPDEEDLYMLALPAHLLVFVPTGILFLTWFVAAYRNVRNFGIEGLTATPGWAAGFFFVPIVNIFRPYQIAQEVWKASDPDLDDREPWSSAPMSGLIFFWWFAWIVALFALQIESKLMEQLPENFRAATISGIVSLMSFVLAGALLRTIVGAIAWRQEEKWHRLHEDRERGDD